MTIFPQLFLTFYLTVIQRPLLPLDTITGGFMLANMIIELVLLYKAARRVVQEKTARSVTSASNARIAVIM